VGRADRREPGAHAREQGAEVAAELGHSRLVGDGAEEERHPESIEETEPDDEDAGDHEEDAGHGERGAAVAEGGR
jgi:hypothetical protein